MAPQNIRGRFIKIGKLHSANNLKLRAERYEKTFGNCMKFELPLDETEEEYDISAEYFKRNPLEGFEGFTCKYPVLQNYLMVNERILDFEINLPFSSDEDDVEEEEEEEEKKPISLIIGYNREKGTTFWGESINIGDDKGCNLDYSSDEADPQRPVSKLSLDSYEKCDDSGVDYDSDYYFSENDKNKKVIYGQIEGYPSGAVWKNRRGCSKSLVHVPCKSRIHAGVNAACSLVLSSQELVRDEGSCFSYNSKAKVEKYGPDATNNAIGCNKALRCNFMKRIPIRVIRGYQLGNTFAPKEGYRYDGLYKVTSMVDVEVREGYQYCTSNFEKCDTQDLPWSKNEPTAGGVCGQLQVNNEMDDIEAESPSLAMDRLLGSRSKMTPIVKVLRLSPTFIEQAINKKSEKGNKKHGKPKKVVSQKRSRSSGTSKNAKTKKKNAKLNRSTAEEENNATAPAKRRCTNRKRASSVSSEEEGNMEKNWVQTGGNKRSISRMGNPYRRKFLQN